MSELAPFLITTGRTLSQMSLYNADHPSVKETVAESHRLLTALLASTDVTLSVSENKLLVNGKPQENIPDSAARPFILLLTALDLHSLTFEPNLSEGELKVFFNLATRNEAKNVRGNLASYFTERNVGHIKVNQAKYERIGEDQTVGLEFGAAVGGNDLWKDLGSLSLNDLLQKLVEKAVGNTGQRLQVFNRAMDLIRAQIDESVRKAAAEFNREKTRMTNERERTEGVINTVADGVVVVDETGHILMMNPAAEHIYGVKLGECIGRGLSEGLQKEQMVAIARDLKVPTDRPIDKTVNVHSDPETQRALRASAATVQDTDGRVVGMVSIASDVAKHRELVRMQNEFMANVTHDLRTPIHALKLAVEAILEGSAGPTTNEQTRMLSLATRNVERLSRLIDNLLDFSQVESGSLQIKPQVIEVMPLLKDSVASLEAWSKSRGISLVLEDTGSLSPAFADSDRILQVITNLISNAIKFTPSGGRVILRAKDLKGGRPQVQIDVEDTGTGISKDDQRRIFERFVQLKNQERLDIRGTGLGLSICKALVDLHKGQLSVVSPPPGKPNGTLFSFTVPSVQGSGGSGPTVAETESVPDEKSKKKNFISRFFSRFHLFLFLVACAGVCEARPYVANVRRVLEGDLVLLDDGSRVRYLGIDSPDKGSAYYEESVAANKRWVQGKEVRFDYGIQDRAADGAWLAYVYLNGSFVNKELIREGWALVTPLLNEEKSLPELIRAEREALQNKRGLWKDSVIDPYSIRIQKKQVPPWKKP